MNKVDLIVDMQYGSTGKGLIAGFLAEERSYDTVINANMPNAGHTYINSAGREWIHKVLPSSIVSPGLKRVMIGPGSVFAVERFFEEVKASEDILEGVQILIHPLATIVSDEHVKAEKVIALELGSTGQGSGAASVQKIMRGAHGLPTLSRDLEELKQYIVSHDEWNQALRDSESILAEGAQGFSLSLNERFYPMCTSRDCTPARFLSDMGIPVQMLNTVIGAARTLPIRSGGNTGGCYGDQRELSWEELGITTEKATVTKKPRRVFSFSNKQIEDAIWALQPDEIFLNFCNYVEEEEVSRIVTVMDRASLRDCGKEVDILLGYGPTIDNVERI